MSDTQAASRIGALTSCVLLFFKTGGCELNAKKSVNFRIQLSKNRTPQLLSHNNGQRRLKQGKSARFLIVFGSDRISEFFSLRLLSCGVLRTTNCSLCQDINHIQHEGREVREVKSKNSILLRVFRVLREQSMKKGRRILRRPYISCLP
jgi:hypothetical protein